MIPDLVADVGNTRIKWGVCSEDSTQVVHLISLPNDPAEWERQRDEFQGGPLRWVIASVQPARSDRLIEFLRGRGDEVVLLRHADLPLKVNVEEPHKVGIDRLLNALAVIPLLGQGEPAVVIDAGSAVTVDYVSPDQAFEGGTIFPGLELMAEALHRYTALLPRITVTRSLPPLPGTSTAAAMEGGIYHAVVGGIREIIAAYRRLTVAPPRVYLTGGQAALLAPALPDTRAWPEMTLMGILIAARGLP